VARQLAAAEAAQKQTERVTKQLVEAQQRIENTEVVAEAS
jgi:hypothetical protein